MPVVPTKTPEYKRILDRLRKEAELRKSRPNWIEMEQKAMHEEVNTIRAEAGKGPVSLYQVLRVEALAVGHSDYAHKFAFYCWELTQEEDPERHACHG